MLRSIVVYNNPWTLLAWRRFYRQILVRGQLAFDVGAHVGTRARAMHAVGARVIACEPQELFARYLRATLPRDITVVHAAVGKEETTASMAVSSSHPTVSSLKPDFVVGASSAPGFGHVKWDTRESVTVTTLDRLIETHGVPSYVKIDVEGFELDVLGGLSQAIELISVEFLPGFPDLTLQVIDRLMDFGPYRFNPVMGETARFLWPQWRDGPAARAWLESLPSDSSSGDLFARLRHDS